MSKISNKLKVEIKIWLHEITKNSQMLYLYQSDGNYAHESTYYIKY